MGGRDLKELGEVFVPERRKWKDTKGEGIYSFVCNRQNCTTNLFVPGVLPGYKKFDFSFWGLYRRFFDHKVVLGQVFSDYVRT